MEKKTIGQFIAALRKANGMTQKELAEKLNVSDKAVSRWERDENAPDLSLIPVIAEIFGVTSDEILRGERAAAKEAVAEGRSERGKKQMALLLEKAQSKFKIYSLISLGIGGVGLIAAMIGNLGFLRAHIGFFIGCIFFLAAGICEGIFYTMTMSSLKVEDEDSSAEELETLKAVRGGIRKGLVKSLLAVLCLFVFCLPLLVLVGDPHWGLSFDSWLVSGAIFTVPVWVVAHVVLWKFSLKSGKELFALTEQEAQDNRKKLGCLKMVAIIMSVTGVLQLVFYNQVSTNDWFAEKEVFDNYEEFVAYMETAKSPDGTHYYEWIENVKDELMNRDDISGEEVNVSESTDTSQEENYVELKDSSGKVLCKYRERNYSVAGIQYGEEENGYLPITVLTNQAINAQSEFMNNVVTPIFLLIYGLEAFSGVLSYRSYKRKLA